MSKLLQRKDATIYLCKYQVDNLILMKGDEKIKTTRTNVIAVEYMCDYEMNLRAVLKVSLRVDVRQRLWIIKNKREITAKFEVTKVAMDTATEEEVLDPESAFNVEFGIYLNDDDENIDIDVTEARLDKNESGNYEMDDLKHENYYESENFIDIYLFEKKSMQASQKTYNEVSTEDTLQQYVGRMLTETGHGNVLMSRFENDEVYKELLCPALPTYKALAYLDQYYGFYKSGAMIFYDIDTLYILNSNGKITAKRKDEFSETMILVNKLDEATPGDGMVRLGDEKVFYVSVNDTNVSVQKPSIGNNVNVGSEAKVVVSDDISVDIAEADQSYTDKRNETIVNRKKDDNKFSADILKTRMEENEFVLYVSANNLDIHAFRPNKQFQFTFDDETKQEKYGKFKYRIIYQYAMLKTAGEKWMESSHILVFKKSGASS